jgi:hypothetical protein
MQAALVKRIKLRIFTQYLDANTLENVHAALLHFQGNESDLDRATNKDLFKAVNQLSGKSSVRMPEATALKGSALLSHENIAIIFDRLESHIDPGHKINAYATELSGTVDVDEDADVEELAQAVTLDPARLQGIFKTIANKIGIAAPSATAQQPVGLVEQFQRSYNAIVPPLVADVRAMCGAAAATRSTQAVSALVKRINGAISEIEELYESITVNCSEENKYVIAQIKKRQVEYLQNTLLPNVQGLQSAASGNGHAALGGGGGGGKDDHTDYPSSDCASFLLGSDDASDEETKQAALQTQRAISQVQLADGKTVKSITVEVSADGDCGFTATAYALKIAGLDDVAGKVSRKGFIQSVRETIPTLADDFAEKDELLKLLIEIMSNNAARRKSASALDSAADKLAWLQANVHYWALDFKEWATDAHLSFLAHAHDISFQVYVVDHTINNIIARPQGVNNIKAPAQGRPVVCLLHVSGDLVDTNSAVDPNTHFDVVCLAPTAGTVQRISDLNYKITQDHPMSLVTGHAHREDSFGVGASKGDGGNSDETKSDETKSGSSSARVRVTAHGGGGADGSSLDRADPVKNATVKNATVKNATEEIVAELQEINPHKRRVFGVDSRAITTVKVDQALKALQSDVAKIDVSLQKIGKLIAEYVKQINEKQPNSVLQYFAEEFVDDSVDDSVSVVEGKKTQLEIMLQLLSDVQGSSLPSIASSLKEISRTTENKADIDVVDKKIKKANNQCDILRIKLLDAAHDFFQKVFALEREVATVQVPARLVRLPSILRSIVAMPYALLPGAGDKKAKETKQKLVACLDKLQELSKECDVHVAAAIKAPEQYEAAIKMAKEELEAKRQEFLAHITGVNFSDVALVLMKLDQGDRGGLEKHKAEKCVNINNVIDRTLAAIDATDFKGAAAAAAVTGGINAIKDQTINFIEEFHRYSIDIYVMTQELQRYLDIAEDVLAAAVAQALSGKLGDVYQKSIEKCKEYQDAFASNQYITGYVKAPLGGQDNLNKIRERFSSFVGQFKSIETLLQEARQMVQQLVPAGKGVTVIQSLAESNKTFVSVFDDFTENFRAFKDFSGKYAAIAADSGIKPDIKGDIESLRKFESDINTHMRKLTAQQSIFSMAFLNLKSAVNKLITDKDREQRAAVEQALRHSASSGIRAARAETEDAREAVDDLYLSLDAELSVIQTQITANFNLEEEPVLDLADKADEVAAKALNWQNTIRIREVSFIKSEFNEKFTELLTSAESLAAEAKKADRFIECGKSILQKITDRTDSFVKDFRELLSSQKAAYDKASFAYLQQGTKEYLSAPYLQKYKDSAFVQKITAEFDVVKTLAELYEQTVKFNELAQGILNFPGLPLAEDIQDFNEHALGLLHSLSSHQGGEVFKNILELVIAQQEKCRAKIVDPAKSELADSAKKSIAELEEQTQDVDAQKEASVAAQKKGLIEKTFKRTSEEFKKLTGEIAEKDKQLDAIAEEIEKISAQVPSLELKDQAYKLAAELLQKGSSIAASVKNNLDPILFDEKFYLANVSKNYQNLRHALQSLISGIDGKKNRDALTAEIKKLYLDNMQQTYTTYAHQLSAIIKAESTKADKSFQHKNARNVETSIADVVAAIAELEKFIAHVNEFGQELLESVATSEEDATETIQSLFAVFAGFSRELRDYVNQKNNLDSRYNNLVRVNAIISPLRDSVIKLTAQQTVLVRAKLAEHTEAREKLNQNDIEPCVASVTDLQQSFADCEGARKALLASFAVELNKEENANIKAEGLEDGIAELTEKANEHLAVLQKLKDAADLGLVAIDIHKLKVAVQEVVDGEEDAGAKIETMTARLVDIISFLARNAIISMHAIDKKDSSYGAEIKEHHSNIFIVLTNAISISLGLVEAKLQQIFAAKNYALPDELENIFVQMQQAYGLIQANNVDQRAEFASKFSNVKNIIEDVIPALAQAQQFTKGDKSGAEAAQKEGFLTLITDVLGALRDLYGHDFTAPEFAASAEESIYKAALRTVGLKLQEIKITNTSIEDLLKEHSSAIEKFNKLPSISSDAVAVLRDFIVKFKEELDAFIARNPTQVEDPRIQTLVAAQAADAQALAEILTIQNTIDGIERDLISKQAQHSTEDFTTALPEISAELRDGKFAPAVATIANHLVVVQIAIAVYKNFAEYKKHLAETRGNLAAYRADNFNLNEYQELSAAIFLARENFVQRDRQNLQQANIDLGSLSDFFTLHEIEKKQVTESAGEIVAKINEAKDVLVMREGQLKDARAVVDKEDLLANSTASVIEQCEKLTASLFDSCNNDIARLQKNNTVGVFNFAISYLESIAAQAKNVVALRKLKLIYDALSKIKSAILELGNISGVDSVSSVEELNGLLAHFSESGGVTAGLCFTSITTGKLLLTEASSDDEDESPTESITITATSVRDNLNSLKGCIESICMLNTYFNALHALLAARDPSSVFMTQEEHDSTLVLLGRISACADAVAAGLHTDAPKLTNQAAAIKSMVAGYVKILELDSSLSLWFRETKIMALAVDGFTHDVTEISRCVAEVRATDASNIELLESELNRIAYKLAVYKDYAKHVAAVQTKLRKFNALGLNAAPADADADSSGEEADDGYTSDASTDSSASVQASESKADRRRRALISVDLADIAKKIASVKKVKVNGTKEKITDEVIQGRFKALGATASRLSRYITDDHKELRAARKDIASIKESAAAIKARVAALDNVHGSEDVAGSADLANDINDLVRSCNAKAGVWRGLETADLLVGSIDFLQQTQVELQKLLPHKLAELAIARRAAGLEKIKAAADKLPLANSEGFCGAVIKEMELLATNAEFIEAVPGESDFIDRMQDIKSGLYAAFAEGFCSVVLSLIYAIPNEDAERETVSSYFIMATECVKKFQCVISKHFSEMHFSDKSSASNIALQEPLENFSKKMIGLELRIAEFEVAELKGKIEAFNAEFNDNAADSSFADRVKALLQHLAQRKEFRNFLGLLTPILDKLDADQDEGAKELTAARAAALKEFEVRTASLEIAMVGLNLGVLDSQAAHLDLDNKEQFKEYLSLRRAYLRNDKYKEDIPTALRLQDDSSIAAALAALETAVTAFGSATEEVFAGVIGGYVFLSSKDVNRENNNASKFAADIRSDSEYIKAVESIKAGERVSFPVAVSALPSNTKELREAFYQILQKWLLPLNAAYVENRFNQNPGISLFQQVLHSYSAAVVAVADDPFVASRPAPRALLAKISELGSSLEKYATNKNMLDAAEKTAPTFIKESLIKYFKDLNKEELLSFVSKLNKHYRVLLEENTELHLEIAKTTKMIAEIYAPYVGSWYGIREADLARLKEELSSKESLESLYGERLAYETDGSSDLDERMATVLSRLCAEHRDKFIEKRFKETYKNNLEALKIKLVSEMMKPFSSAERKGSGEDVSDGFYLPPAEKTFYSATEDATRIATLFINKLCQYIFPDDAKAKVESLVYALEKLSNCDYSFLQKTDAAYAASCFSAMIRVEFYKQQDIDIRSYLESNLPAMIDVDVVSFVRQLLDYDLDQYSSVSIKAEGLVNEFEHKKIRNLVKESDVYNASTYFGSDAEDKDFDALVNARPQAVGKVFYLLTRFGSLASNSVEDLQRYCGVLAVGFDKIDAINQKLLENALEMSSVLPQQAQVLEEKLDEITAKVICTSRPGLNYRDSDFFTGDQKQYYNWAGFVELCSYRIKTLKLMLTDSSLSAQQKDDLNKNILAINESLTKISRIIASDLSDLVNLKTQSKDKNKLLAHEAEAKLRILIHKAMTSFTELLQIKLQDVSGGGLDVLAKFNSAINRYLLIQKTMRSLGALSDEGLVKEGVFSDRERQQGQFLADSQRTGSRYLALKNTAAKVQGLFVGFKESVNGLGEAMDSFAVGLYSDRGLYSAEEIQYLSSIPKSAPSRSRSTPQKSDYPNADDRAAERDWHRRVKRAAVRVSDAVDSDASSADTKSTHSSAGTSSTRGTLNHVVGSSFTQYEAAILPDVMEYYDKFMSLVSGFLLHEEIIKLVSYRKSGSIKLEAYLQVILRAISGMKLGNQIAEAGQLALIIGEKTASRTEEIKAMDNIRGHIVKPKSGLQDLLATMVSSLQSEKGDIQRFCAKCLYEMMHIVERSYKYAIRALEYRNPKLCFEIYRYAKIFHALMEHVWSNLAISMTGALNNPSLLRPLIEQGLMSNKKTLGLFATYEYRLFQSFNILKKILSNAMLSGIDYSFDPKFAKLFYSSCLSIAGIPEIDLNNLNKNELIEVGSSLGKIIQVIGSINKGKDESSLEFQSDLEVAQASREKIKQEISARFNTQMQICDDQSTGSENISQLKARLREVNKLIAKLPDAAKVASAETDGFDQSALDVADFYLLQQKKLYARALAEQTAITSTIGQLYKSKLKSLPVVISEDDVDSVICEAILLICLWFSNNAAGTTCNVSKEDCDNAYRALDAAVENKIALFKRTLTTDVDGSDIKTEVNRIYALFKTAVTNALQFAFDNLPVSGTAGYYLEYIKQLNAAIQGFDFGDDICFGVLQKECQKLFASAEKLITTEPFAQKAVASKIKLLNEKSANLNDHFQRAVSRSGTLDFSSMLPNGGGGASAASPSNSGSSSGIVSTKGLRRSTSSGNGGGAAASTPASTPASSGARSSRSGSVSSFSASAHNGNGGGAAASTLASPGARSSSSGSVPAPAANGLVSDLSAVLELFNKMPVELQTKSQFILNALIASNSAVAQKVYAVWLLKYALLYAEINILKDKEEPVPVAELAGLLHKLGLGSLVLEYMRGGADTVNRILSMIKDRLDRYRLDNHADQDSKANLNSPFSIVSGHCISSRDLLSTTHALIRSTRGQRKKDIAHLFNKIQEDFLEMSAEINKLNNTMVN